MDHRLSKMICLHLELPIKRQSGILSIILSNDPLQTIVIECSFIKS